MDKLVEKMEIHQAEAFEIDIRKIDISNIWIGVRRELDESFFEDYEYTIYKRKKSFNSKISVS